MPFTCEVRFNEQNLGSVLPSGGASFGQYLAQPGDFIETGGQLLFFSSADRLFAVRTRFPAQLREAPLETGDPLEPDTVLAILAAEGEDIPSGFRYCTLRELRDS